MSAPRLLRRQNRPRSITGTCPICAVSFVLSAAQGVMAHGPAGRPRCPGSGLRVEPDRYPTPLAAIRAAENRLRIPEWRLLEPQPCEAGR